MKINKILFISTSILTVFLFSAGLYVLSYFNATSGQPTSSDNPFFDFMFKDVKQAMNEPFNVLLLTRDIESGNTDTMMLVNFDPTSGNVNVLSIPRDTKVKVKGSYHKVNATFQRGENIAPGQG